AELITELMPSIEMVRMVSSGTEASMSAIRLARGFTKRDVIIKFAGCYHGHVDSLLVSAGSSALTHGVPNSPGVPPGCTNDPRRPRRLHERHAGAGLQCRRGGRSRVRPARPRNRRRDSGTRCRQHGPRRTDTRVSQGAAHADRETWRLVDLRRSDDRLPSVAR